MLTRRSLNRRNLLSTALAGSAAFLAGATAARAFSVEPMPHDVAAAYALGCGNAGGHGQLMQTAQTTLRHDIASGLKPPGAQEIVICPICGCRMVVSATPSL
ncbi:MAG TPA: hypothetical protein VMW18_14835 [Candidatus Binatia bacterium]|nr:hypothetical protein [Candidatus Binatia bacterium]